MSLATFTSEVKTRGLARTNKYEVVIPFPDPTTNTRLISLFCDSTSLPGITVATTPHRFYGEVREMPYERMFEPVTMTFYVDAAMTVKAAFDKWNFSIVDQQTRSVNYYENYVKPIYIYSHTDGYKPTLGRGSTVGEVGPNAGQVVEESPCVITLHEAYPKVVGPIQLDAANKDIMKVSVTFQYRYWTSTQVGLPQNNNPEQDPFDVITGTGFNNSNLSTVSGLNTIRNPAFRQALQTLIG